jgi:hypothetical protein
MEIETDFDPTRAVEVAVGAFIALVAVGTLKVILNSLLT